VRWRKRSRESRDRHTDSELKKKRGDEKKRERMTTLKIKRKDDGKNEKEKKRTKEEKRERVPKLPCGVYNRCGSNPERAKHSSFSLQREL
jgi:hypothetical protein